MRIAFIVGRFPSLSQTFILNQITGLIDQGHAVDIYADGTANGGKAHPDVESYGLLKRTHYFNVPEQRMVKKLNVVWLILSQFTKSLDLLLRTVKSYGSRHDIKPLGWVQPYIAAPFVGADPYDVIYCHFGPNGLKGLAVKDIISLKGKLVTTFHGYDLTKYLQSYGKDVYKALFEYGDAFLPISNHWKSTLVQLGCEERKIIVHRMGVDTKKFPFSPRRPDQDGTIRIVTIARLVEKKGVEYGIKAVAKLARIYPNVEYYIIGDGPLRHDLQALVSAHSAEEIITLVGWQQQDEISEWLNKSHILLAPSVTSPDGDKEGIPVVLMEAMSMGLPVVSTYHSGIPELIEDGKTGHLVPERDVDALFEKLKFLVNNPEEWIPLGQREHAFVEQKFEIVKLNHRLTRIFEQLIER